MLSQQAKDILTVALANDSLADEAAARMITETPVDPEASADILETLDSSVRMKKALEEVFVVALADREAGLEIAQKLQKGVEVLQAHADGTNAAVAASFVGQVAGMTTDVTIEADTASADGNSILLEFDGLDDIDAAILAWNTANPANTASLTDGDGSQIPDNGEEIQLAGGSDEEDDNFYAALEAFGEDKMSDRTFERLVVCMASRSAALEFKEAYSDFVDSINDMTSSV